MSDCPKEVRENAERRFSSLSKLLGYPERQKEKDNAFDIDRLVWYPKVTFSRCDAWIAALKTKKALYSDSQNGWRKCHTENFWCYYAEKIT